MTITTHNPATGETLRDYRELDGADIEAALARAADRFRHWRGTGLDERSRLLSAIADAFDARREELARQTTLEMGKTYKSALAEADKCVAGFRHYAEHGAAMLANRDYSLSDGSRATGLWLPLGPVLAVMPWNFPLWQVVRFLAPAIMAGNVALLKHASSVMGVAELMADVVRGAGAPEGLFQNLVIRAGAVEGIIADERIAAVTLTGSEGAGSAVASAAGKHLKKVVLELGGSDPFIVMPSADLDAAARTAVTARVQNTGQSCICGKRMIVHRAVYQPFLERFEAGMRAVVAGDPFDAASDMGPLSSFEQRETVLDQVEALEAEGATRLFGGEAIGERGAFMNAGIVTGVDPHSEIAREEIFGPVAMLFEADDIDAAIRIANAVPFGLGSAVFTQEDAEIARFASGIESGMTAVNRLLASDPRAPFGGIKKSGHGRELAAVGMHEFMNLKTIFGA